MAGPTHPRRYHLKLRAVGPMHVSILQPLLILAAIAIVGAAPLLGAVRPVPPIGVSSSVVRGSDAVAGASRSAGVALARVVSSSSQGTHGGNARSHSHDLCAAQLACAVRCGTRSLPPPSA